jgi:hypothetical protein
MPSCFKLSGLICVTAIGVRCSASCASARLKLSRMKRVPGARGCLHFHRRLIVHRLRGSSHGRSDGEQDESAESVSLAKRHQAEQISLVSSGSSSGMCVGG